MFVTFGNAIKQLESNQHSRNDIKVHVLKKKKKKDDIIPRHVGEVFSVAPHSWKITVVPKKVWRNFLLNHPRNTKFLIFIQ